MKIVICIICFSTQLSIIIGVNKIYFKFNCQMNYLNTNRINKIEENKSDT